MRPMVPRRDQLDAPAAIARGGGAPGTPIGDWPDASEAELRHLRAKGCHCGEGCSNHGQRGPWPRSFAETPDQRGEGKRHQSSEQAVLQQLDAIAMDLFRRGRAAHTRPEGNYAHDRQEDPPRPDRHDSRNDVDHDAPADAAPPTCSVSCPSCTALVRHTGNIGVAARRQEGRGTSQAGMPRSGPVTDVCRHARSRCRKPNGVVMIMSARWAHTNRNGRSKSQGTSDDRRRTPT